MWKNTHYLSTGYPTECLLHAGCTFNMHIRHLRI